VDEVRPRLVVVTGDVRATQFLRDQIPGRVGELLQVVDGEYGSLDAALANQLPDGCGPIGGIGALLRYAGRAGDR
jgi:hypothetical protein